MRKRSTIKTIGLAIGASNGDEDRLPPSWGGSQASDSARTKEEISGSDSAPSVRRTPGVEQAGGGSHDGGQGSREACSQRITAWAEPEVKQDLGRGLGQLLAPEHEAACLTFLM